MPNSGFWMNNSIPTVKNSVELACECGIEVQIPKKHFPMSFTCMWCYSNPAQANSVKGGSNEGEE